MEVFIHNLCICAVYVCSVHALCACFTIPHSTFVDPDMRQAMGAQAVALSKAVGYSSAGRLCLLPSSGFVFTLNSYLYSEMLP